MTSSKQKSSEATASSGDRKRRGSTSLAPPSTPDVEASPRSGPINYIKRRWLNKSDGSLNYDSDATSRRSWRKSSSLTNLDKAKLFKSISRDSSPMRPRSYIDLYNRDDKEKIPKKKASTRRSTGNIETSRRRSGKKKGSRKNKPTTEYSDAESESSQDIPLAAHDLSNMKGKKAPSGYTNFIGMMYGNAGESDSEPSRSRRSLETSNSSGHDGRRRSQSLPQREYDSDAGAQRSKKKKLVGSPKERDYDSDTLGKKLPSRRSGVETPPESGEEDRFRSLDSPSTIPLKDSNDSTGGKLKKKKSSRGKKSSIRSERTLGSIDSKSARSEQSKDSKSVVTRKSLDTTSPGDLMDAPVPPRRKVSSFKEEKEKMERELLFTKLEVVRLQETLEEAEEKTQEMVETQKRDRSDLEKATNELKQLKQSSSGTSDGGELRIQVRDLKSEIADKDKKIDELNEAVERQTCKVEHLEAELKSAEEDMQNVEADMKYLENELEALNWKREEQDISNHSLDGSDDLGRDFENSHVNHNLDTRQAELEAWENRLKTRELQLEEQGSGRKADNYDDDDVSVELDRLEQKIPGLENMTNLAIEVMQKEMAEMRSWVVKSAKELDADRALLEDDGAKLKDLNDENEKLRKWLEEEQADYEKKLSRQEKISESLRTELGAVQDELRQERTTRKEDATYWDDMEREINQQLKEVSDEKKALSERLERALRRAASAESKLATSRSELKEHLGTISRLQDRVKEANDNPQWNNSKLERELERMQYKNDLLREKLHKYEEMQSNGVSGNPPQRNAQIQRELARLEQKNDTLRERLEKYDSQAAMNRENEEKVRMLRSEVDRLKMEVDGTKALNETFVENERNLEKEIVESQCKLEETSQRLQDSLDKLVQERDKLEEEVETLRKDRDTEVMQLRATIEELKEKNETLETKIQEEDQLPSKKSTKVLEAEVGRLQQRLKETWKQFEKRHPAEYGALLQELKIRKGEVDTVRRSMFEVQERNRRLEQEVLELSQKIEFDASARDSDDRLPVDHHESQAESDSLRAELEEWKNAASKWQEKAETSVKESLEWKKRSEEWEQEAAQWEHIATETQAAAQLGADRQKLASASTEEASRSHNPTSVPTVSTTDEEDRIRGLTRQNAALDEMIAEIQGELTALSGDEELAIA